MAARGHGFLAWHAVTHWVSEMDDEVSGNADRILDEPLAEGSGHCDVLADPWTGLVEPLCRSSRAGGPFEALQLFAVVKLRAVAKDAARQVRLPTTWPARDDDPLRP